jgi:hypothetical protein
VPRRHDRYAAEQLLLSSQHAVEPGEPPLRAGDDDADTDLLPRRHDRYAAELPMSAQHAVEPREPPLHAGDDDADTDLLPRRHDRYAAEQLLLSSQYAVEPREPPLQPLEALKSVADRALDPVLNFVAAYPPPRVVEPLDFIGLLIDTTEGRIIQISEPNTMAALQQIRTKVIESSFGHRDFVIVEKQVGRCLKEGMPTSCILDLMESNLRRAYEFMGVDFRF